LTSKIPRLLGYGAACIFVLALSATHSAAQSRASQLSGFTTGLGMDMSMGEFLKNYPSCRTAIIAYIPIDSTAATGVVNTLEIQHRVQKQMAREFWPQIAIETDHMTLAEFRRQLDTRGSDLDYNVRQLAKGVARYRDASKWVFIRPFSEMNDGSSPWQFATEGCNNSPGDFAAAWNRLHEVFDEEGATNALFVFSPLAAQTVHHESDVLAALNRIPKGYIDAFGLNVYSRPANAYGRGSSEPYSFGNLVEPWLSVLAKSTHRGIPAVVCEMGISNQATTEQRSKWIHDAFKYARSHGFKMATYFNFKHVKRLDWVIGDGTVEEVALRSELDAGDAGHPLEVADATPSPARKDPPPALPKPVAPAPITVLDAPLTSPPDKSVWETLPDLAWQPVSNAERYHVEVCRAQDLDHPVFTMETTSDHCTVPAGTLRMGQSYSWRVVSLRGEARSDGAVRYSFMIDTVDPPKLLGPQVGATEAPWFAGSIAVSISVQTRNLVREVVAISQAPDGGTIRTPLSAAPGSDRWQGSVDPGANRSDRRKDAQITFQATDVQGKTTSSSAILVSVKPRDASAGPLLDLGAVSDAGATAQGVITIRSLRDRLVRNGRIGYYLRVDGQTIASSRATPFAVNWDTATIADGDHKIVLVLRDTASGEEQIADVVRITTKNQK
jgi:hypothetical protein